MLFQPRAANSSTTNSPVLATLAHPVRAPALALSLCVGVPMGTGEHAVPLINAYRRENRHGLGQYWTDIFRSVNADVLDFDEFRDIWVIVLLG